VERLTELYHNGLMDWPRAQLDYYATAGLAPIVYGLGNVGALVLAERDGMDLAQVEWTWKCVATKRPFRHTSRLRGRAPTTSRSRNRMMMVGRLSYSSLDTTHGLTDI
jgi:hypothetical protein